jgi:SsrA-binding protein
MQIINKKAHFNYSLQEKFEAGISLIGSEAKTLRTKGGDLSNSYAKIINGEVYLINFNIPIENKKNFDPLRTRKLLLHKNEILAISTKIKSQNLTIIPVKMYNKHRLYKIELALAKTKRKFEKRQDIKKKDVEREIAQGIKGDFRG